MAAQQERDRASGRMTGSRETMKKSEYKYLFGPVASRRFGRSLGVDMVPFKTCSFNCVFCQLGRTQSITTERSEYVPTEAVLAELHDWFSDTEASADYITLAGSGEPTLHTRFGEVLAYVREHSHNRTALLTNGALFYVPEVRQHAGEAHVVEMSLSAWDQGSLELVNRPDKSMSFERMLGGMREFRREFKGELYVEVFVLNGINSDESDMIKLSELVNGIGPDAVHLNTVVRPPAEECALAVPAAVMEQRKGLFDNCSIVATVPPEQSEAASPSLGGADGTLTDESILAVVRRHPATVGQLALVFGAEKTRVAEHLKRLCGAGSIRVTGKGDEEYYSGA